MSFRTRLTSFFVLIVVLPMIAVGFLVFRLISDSEQGKADARANGLATFAASVYQSEIATGRSDARQIAGDTSLLNGPGLRARLTAIASQAGLSRVALTQSNRVLADVGDRSAVAPGSVQIVRASAATPITVTVSALNASQYARELSAADAGVVVRQSGRTLSSTVPIPALSPLPRQGEITAAGSSYRTVTQSFPGFGGQPVQVAVLSNMNATSSSVGSSRAVAAVFIAGFLLLAFAFSVLASRALQGQLRRFLEAARRLASGDFSSPIPTEGHDEFAALGTEFNNMSNQLEHRLDELQQERARLRESIRRIGQTFASNLDRPALLDLALQTAVDGVKASCGRLSVRPNADEPLAESQRVGSFAGLEEQVYEAERMAMGNGAMGDASSDEWGVLSIAIGALDQGARVQALITVGRGSPAFTDDDRLLLRSLAAQATLALENVDLHFQVRKQAVTDELTGLANHGRFQDLLSSEIEQVRRYHHQLGLIMLDIDNFKSVNDTYGHQQGDVVLKQVARVLSDTSREADTAARYGGEELTLILPHTDLEGSYAIAERVRTEVAALRIARLDGQGVLRVTASLGVAASSDGIKDDLIADADGALYTAKRDGKNRTVRAPARAANVVTAE
jgi:diguanylate cyclase (GGDEF)-like protein